MVVKKSKTRSKSIDLSKFVEDIRKKGVAVEYTTDTTPPSEIKYISTGDPILDIAMGGGIPIGKFVEIYGEESTSKSTLAQHIVNNVVNNHDGYALVLDVENNSWGLNLKRNLELGLNPDKKDRIVCVSPTTIETVFDLIKTYITDLVKNNKVTDVPIIIVWDSIAASTSLDETEKEEGNTGYLNHSRIINSEHRKLVAMLNGQLLEGKRVENVTFLWLNQARKELSISANPYAPTKYVTFGGKAPAFFSSVRVELRKKKTIDGTKRNKKYKIGIKVLAKVVKNKISQAYQEAEFYVFSKGVDACYGVFSFLKENKLLKTGKDKKYKISLSTPIEFDTYKEFKEIYNTSKDNIVSMIREYILGSIEDVTKSKLE